MFMDCMETIFAFIQIKKVCYGLPLRVYENVVYTFTIPKLLISTTIGDSAERVLLLVLDINCGGST
jgi:hypothetical protein